MLDAEYAYFDVGMALAHIAPYAAGFTETAVGIERFFGPQKAERLRAVKADVDPDNVFQANHAID